MLLGICVTIVLLDTGEGKTFLIKTQDQHSYDAGNSLEHGLDLADENGKFKFKIIPKDVKERNFEQVILQSELSDTCQLAPPELLLSFNPPSD